MLLRLQNFGLIWVLILGACAAEREFKNPLSFDDDNDGIIAGFDCDDGDRDKGACEMGEACTFDEQCGSEKCEDAVCVCPDPIAGTECGKCATSLEHNQCRESETCESGNCVGHGLHEDPDALLRAKGNYNGTIDDQAFVLDYDGMEATAEVFHKLSADPDGYGCITEATLYVAKEDGSCPLTLKYRPGFAGEGLVLRSAEFHAKKGVLQDGVVTDTIPCTDSPTESASGEVIYTLSDGTGSINLQPIAAPGSTQDVVNLTDANLKPTGTITLKFRAAGSSAKEFQLDLSEVSFQGDLTSTGVSEGECARYFEPYPEWELTDVNESSPYYNETYGLHRFKGKIVVVLLSATW